MGSIVIPPSGEFWVHYKPGDFQIRTKGIGKKGGLSLYQFFGREKVESYWVIQNLITRFLVCRS